MRNIAVMIFPLILSALWCVLGVQGGWNAHRPPKNDCARKCVDGQMPKTCYYYFHLEQYSTMGWSCNNCTSQVDCQCILADGVERSVYTANRMIPGPLIEVCKGDTVVVDVENNIDGTEVTIHWHGIWQIGTPYHDGVPFVTQCPLLSGNTFRYIWGAVNPGTHFWHAHTGLQKMDGLSGGIIVRQSSSEEHYSLASKTDLRKHVIIVGDWFHYLTAETLPGGLRRPSLIGQIPHSLLINGKGQTRHPDTGFMTETPIEEFIVVPGQTHRFRFVNTIGTFCPLTLTIDQHKLMVISSDGEDIEKTLVDGIQSFSAERFDFILTANQSINSYWMRLRAVGNCAVRQIQQLAVIRYKSAPSRPKAPRPSFNSTVPRGLILNEYTRNCAGDDRNSICFNRLKSIRKVDSGVLKKIPDVKLFLPFGSYAVSGREVFKPNEYRTFMVFGNGELMTHRVDSIEYRSPPSPLISQINDTSPSQLCNKNKKPKNCGEICSCTHVIELPLNAVVELILIDDSSPVGSPHTIHLHGYAFNVMGMGIVPNGTGSSVAKLMNLDRTDMLERRFNQPVFKDTFTVPSNGYAVVRFRANNPGYWLMHCHYAHHVITGMSLVFKVGSDDEMIPIPKNFPKCGNYMPSFNISK